MSFLYIRLWFGQLNVKWASKSMFSERYGFVPTMKIGPFRFTWRRYRSASLAKDGRDE